jgi:hypothetical protein
MAVVTVKSSAIANRDAVPQVKNNPSSEGGRLRSCVGSVAVTSGDGVGSKYILAEIPSNARINQILVYSDDLGTTTVGKIGVYQTTAKWRRFSERCSFCNRSIIERWSYLCF